jgi:hypothetical protein
MSDIVERLRMMADDMLGPYRRTTLEAADEIGRLRTALKPMVEHFNVGGGKVPIGKMLEGARRALEEKT